MKPTALMTASYAGDFERCRLLCESMDHFVSGHSHHYILVEDADLELFSILNSATRTVIGEGDLLPGWFHRVGPSAFTRNKRLWWSFRTRPMRGWHMQQLRRIAMALQADEAALLSCDSDMVFIKPFDVASLWRDGDLRLYRVPGGIDDAKLVVDGANHHEWCRVTMDLFGAPEPHFPADDYINNLVSWDCANVRAMCAAIEAHTGRDWVSAIGRQRTFSECQIYGIWADSMRGGAGHWHDERPLCRTYWTGEAMGSDALRSFMEGAASYQVAVGLQSFTGTDGDLIRPLIGIG